MFPPRVTRRLARAFTLTCALVVASACDDVEITAIESDLITASATAGGGVRLHGLTGQTVYYFVADAETLALLDWIPCTNPTSCPAVPPRGTVDVPRSAIAGDQPGSHTVVVYHWLLVRPGGSFVPDSIRAMEVRR